MSESVTSVTIDEWDSADPNSIDALVNVFLDESPSTRLLVQRLADARLLELTELRHGLRVRSFSFVGRLRIGGVSVTILPKLKGRLLLSLLRYTYGLRRLNLFSDSLHYLDHCGFQDLLINQLVAEVQELVSRGLVRGYIATATRLSSPRGRIDMSQLAREGGLATASLPCTYHPRIEDTLLNQVLMAGLRLASTMTEVVELKRDCRRLMSFMDEEVASVPLTSAMLERAARHINRLTNAYSGAVSIIKLLADARGVVLQEQSKTTTLPGFLFDMNSFFQALMSRFLRENLVGYTIHDERGLRGMMNYNPHFNPHGRRSPTPRPDYVVTQQQRLKTILDAKYRDLWEKPLPREMLYQLVVYAISQPDRPQSSILYPTTNPGAREARIDIADPLFGTALGQVCLRPVVLSALENLVTQNSAQARRDRRLYARRLAFGE